MRESLGRYIPRNGRHWRENCKVQSDFFYFFFPFGAEPINRAKVPFFLSALRRRSVEGEGGNIIRQRYTSPPHMGTTFFIEGAKNFFSCVHGSKIARGEVMFLAAIAWMKRAGGGGDFIH